MDFLILEGLVVIKTRNIGYDFLKFIAAIAVVFQHVLGFKIQEKM